MSKLKHAICVLLVMLVLFVTPSWAQPANPNPQLCILFIVDAMAVGTIGYTGYNWDSTYTDTMVNCANNGVKFNTSYVIAPAHPAEENNSGSSSYYPFGSSLPNPYAMSGSVFIGKVDKYSEFLQHSFTGSNESAFVYNCGAYDEIAYGYDLVCNQSCISSACGGCVGIDCFYNDAPINAVTDEAEDFIDNHWGSLRYIRMHYQGPGSAGWDYPPLWDNTHSRGYPNQVRRCDEELQELIDHLNSTGKMSDTVIFVTGDHGQRDEGWHPWDNEQCDKTPLIVYGKGVKTGATFDYCEHADITATICWLTGKTPPNECEGRILYEAFVGGTDTPNPPRYLERLNTVVRDAYDIYTSGYSGCESEMDDIRQIVNFAQGHYMPPSKPAARLGQWHNSSFYTPAHSDLPTLVAYQEQQFAELEECMNPYPDAPTSLTSPDQGETTVELAWTAPSGGSQPEGYRVYRNGGSVGTTSHPTTAYTDSGLAANTAYTYMVRSFISVNESGDSNTIVATTDEHDGEAPTVPTGLQSPSQSDSSISLSWTASNDNVEVAGYRVYRNGASIGTTGGTSYTDDSLAACTTYTYRVSAFDTAVPANESGQSSPITPKTTGTVQNPNLDGTGAVDEGDLAIFTANWMEQGDPGCPVGDLSFDGEVNLVDFSMFSGAWTGPDTEAPSVPTGFSVTDTSSSTIALDWADSVDNVAVAGYRVFRNTSSVGTTGSSDYTDTGLVAETAYSYTVSAFDTAVPANESAQSTPFVATSGSDNLLTNGSFEDGTNGWSGPVREADATCDGELDTTGTNARTGTNSYRTMGGYKYAYLEQSSPSLSDSTQYTLSIWVKTATSNGNGLSARYIEWPSGGGQNIDSTSWVGDTNDWQEATVTFTTDSSWGSGRLDLLWDYDTGEGWYDDVSLTEN